MNRFRLPIAASAATLFTTLFASGCAVGPDFKTPDAPAVTQYTPQPMVNQTSSAAGVAGAAQVLHNGQDIPAAWWSLYQSPELDQLIKMALVNNPTLVSAASALREAKEQITVSRAGLFPNVSGSVQDARERISPITEGLPPGVYELNVAEAALNASYSVDIFGATRRTIEASRAQADYANFELEAAYLTLTGNLVTTAIKEASLRAQIKATSDVLDAENKELNLLQRQYQFGAINRSNLLTQQSVVAGTQATLPGLQKQLAQTRHQLAVLAGRTPSDTEIPVFTLENLHLPVDIPVSLPSQLVRQRPDVLASEAQLHAASAQIGIAEAALYPSLAISAQYGREGLRYTDLFKGVDTVWTLGAGLTQPIFNAGELRAKKRAAVDGYEQAAANYQETVLTAFQGVADSLRALDTDADALKAYAESESVAKQSLDLSQAQYKLGAVSFFQLLQTETIYQQARVSLAQAQATRLADTAALFQSLGGGWWNRTESLAEAGKPAPTNQ